MPELSNNQIRELIDPHCDAFEAAWQRGERPSPSDFTSEVPVEARSELFAELLGIELELRCQAGDSPTVTEYDSQYPEYSAEIARTFREHTHWLTETAVSASQETDTDSTGLQTQQFSTSGTALVSPAIQPDAAKNEGEQPTEIGHYRIRRLIGRGGMGEVLLADDTKLNRQVAIKLPVFAEHNKAELLSRFQMEAQAMAQVRHANLCPVYEIGEHAGRPWLAMAFVEGQSLLDLIDAGKQFSPSEAVELVRTLATAISAAHEAGVIHRDLKPGNVMIDDKGVPLITDFGLARAVHPGESSVSVTGTQVGTPAYMSPEQVSGDSEAIGPATDVYALGVILFELLTGQRPFQGSGLAVLGQITSGKPPKSPAQIAGVSRQLNSVCLKTMSF